MLYFANPTANPEVHAAMAAGRIGFMDTPRQGKYRHIRDRCVWAADNGCFGQRFKEAAWWRFLEESAYAAPSCVFATAPDVVGDAAATIERSQPWLPKIRALGYPVAFVAQDGSGDYPPPWGTFDVLFIGGTDAFKRHSKTAHELIAEAKQLGMWVHCGRVNSLKMYRAMEARRIDSCDGTYLKFGPTLNLPRMQTWFDDLRDRPALFRMGDC